MSLSGFSQLWTQLWTVHHLPATAVFLSLSCDLFKAAAAGWKDQYLLEEKNELASVQKNGGEVRCESRGLWLSSSLHFRGLLGCSNTRPWNNIHSHYDSLEAPAANRLMASNRCVITTAGLPAQTGMKNAHSSWIFMTVSWDSDGLMRIRSVR